MQNLRSFLVRLVLACACGTSLFAGRAAIAGTIDTDVDLVAISGPTIDGLIAEGRLMVTSSTAAPAKYTGTFVDNLDGGASFAASVDASTASAPLVTLATRAGKFIFKMDSNFGGALFFSQSTQASPTALDSFTFQLNGKSHQFTTQTYAATLEFGGPFVGSKSTVQCTLVLIVDNLSFIAPKDRSTHSISFSEIPGPNGKPLRTAITAPNYFGRFGGGAFGDATKLTINAKIGGRFMAMECTATSTQGQYVGPVFKTGAGSAAANGQATLLLTAVE